MPSRSTWLTAGRLILPAIAATLVVFMVAYPETAFGAALSGLLIWWEVVFPALLPFFIGAQLLMGLGVVRFMGVLMEPLMRPLFNIPGTGSFVTAMGLASGYPIGSVLTAKLRRDGFLTAAEGERLFSLSNTADPLFMAGAVAIGMFGLPEIAGVIMVSHYISCLLVGVGLRFYRPDAPRSPDIRSGGDSVLVRGVHAMLQAREEDGRPFGQLMADSIRRSVDTLLLIGGFIILFSVIIQVMNEVGAVILMRGLLDPLLHLAGLSPATGDAVINGLFEITLGTQGAAEAPAPLMDRVVVAGMIVAWSGLSVHAQVAAMISGTGMSMKPYVISRAFHSILAGILTALLWESPAAELTLPATRLWAEPAGPASWIQTLFSSGQLFLQACGGLTIIALAVALGASIRVVWIRGS